MAQYDLTHTMGQYLDRHLVLPLIEFLQRRELYPETDILKAKLELLSKTNMVDFAGDTYLRLSGAEKIPQEMTDKRENVVARLRQLKNDCAPIVRVLEDVALVKQLKQEKVFTQQHLQDSHQITPENIDALYKFAKFQFECGNYTVSADYLYHFRTLSTNQEKNSSALWGKFAAEILMQNWEPALDDLNKLKEIIDSKSFVSPLKQLQQRTWLIHWSLFVFLNHPNGRNLMVDLFFQDHTSNYRYLNAIQTNCPHMLRYLTAAVVTNKRRRNVIKDLVRVIQQESYTYRDPLTEFIEELYVNFNFEAAQVKLRLCGEVLANDFFLVSLREEFMENAKQSIFETYCRIHQKIDIPTLAEKLDMTQEAAEHWLVNLIRNANFRFDAKIDSAANHIVMGSQYPSIYQTVIEKTKNLSFRSYMLANNLSAQGQRNQRGERRGGNRGDRGGRDRDGDRDGIEREEREEESREGSSAPIEANA